MSFVTIVIPVKNEAQNLERCIPLVSSLGPVLVVDSGSMDSTVEVSQKLGAEVLQFEWDGQFPKKRNWTLRNYDFNTDWVLFLDADEFVSEAFIAEVKSAIESTECVGFWLNFENYFMGQKLKHGDPMRKLALFRVGAGEYERIEEGNWSHLDMEVHEHPVLNGSIGEIQIPIEHNDFRGLKHYIAKHNEYASWESARYQRLHSKRSQASTPSAPDSLRSFPFGGTKSINHSPSQPSCSEWDGLTGRQKKKYSNLAKWWLAPAYFCVTYFLKKGFLDGSAGFHFALMKAYYFYQIRLKIKESSIEN